MKKSLILTAVIGIAAAAGVARADSDDGAGYRLGNGDMTQTAAGHSDSYLGRVLHWITADDDEDDDHGYGDDDDHERYGSAQNQPQPSTPPANGLFESGTPKVETN